MSFRFAFRTSFGYLQDVLARCLACLANTSCRCLFADWVGKRVMPLDHINTIKIKENQQYLGEWDMRLSEPSCFSYNHTLKAFQCLFLFNNDVAYTCILDNNT